MAAVVVIGGECGLRIEACCRTQPNKSKLLLKVAVVCMDIIRLYYVFK